MANKKFSDYVAATTIDAANDYLLISPNNTDTYKRISRNTLFVVTGTPADISSTQTFTNKTLDNTNTITIKDGSFTLQASAATTKQAVFSLTNITAGQTRTLTLPDSNTTLPIISQILTFTGPTAARTYTLPDAAVTLADTSSVQTLTNKTLTSSTNVLGGVTMTLGADASGDVYYRNSSGVLTRVAAGAQNTVLTMGASSVPSWSTSTSQVTLLKANSGTDTSVGTTSVDTFAVSGLTAKDTLFIRVDQAANGGATQASGSAFIYNTTDAKTLAFGTGGGATLASGKSATSTVAIFQAQAASTTINSVVTDGGQTSTAGNSFVAGAVQGGSQVVTTAWTGSWTIALRYGGMAAGTFQWTWAIYKIAGQ